MKKYSLEQLNAINTTTKHAAVIAGAGSGKTTVLIERINNIIDSGANIDSILAITFTKKAATEMSERIKRNDLTIKTFDAFCYEVVSKYSDIKIEIVGKTPFKEAELVKFNNYDVSLKEGDKPSDYDSYVSFKNENNKMDFNDVEYLALELIKEHNIKYDYILIDEFQDTNELQYLIFETLINNNSKTFIVGDPDQSIYGFRGANVSLLNKYINEISTETYILSNNYRSKKKIIESANNLISHNKVRIEKELVPFKEEEGIFYVNSFIDDYMEFNFVVKKIEELIDKYETFAILYRNNYQGYLYRNHFKEEDFPNVLVTTIHQSKGLEFDCVFIIGINEGVIPDNKMNKALEIEEERRLFFVGITRAKKELYLTSSKRTSYSGITKHQKESMFLRETKTNQTLVKAFLKVKPQENVSFNKDDIIIHDKFGEGKIVSVDKKFLIINFFEDYEDRKISIKYKGIKKK